MSFSASISCKSCATCALQTRKSPVAGLRGLCRSSSLQFTSPQARPQRRTSRQLSVHAWGAEVEWSAATVDLTESAATGLQRVIVDVGADIAKGYQRGGQFVQMKVGDSKAAFLAIASPPDPNATGAMEFLIRPVPNSTADVICSLKQGEKALVSPVMGKGFQLDKVPAEQFDTVLIFATGSGISPIKALIESGALNATARKDVRLYYGAANEESMAYSERIEEWERAGIKVIKVFSDDKNGYVQDAFARDKPVVDGSKTAVVLCGQKEMCEAVKEAVAAQGVLLENCLLNF